MIYAPLGQEMRDSVRQIARATYVNRNAWGLGDATDSELRDFFKYRLGLQLTERPRGGFRGVVASVLLSLAVRLAVELFKHWLKQNLHAPAPDGFKKGEPGA